jgi:hypothetical protein
MQHFLKPFSRTAWARIIPPKLFDQLFVAVYSAVAAFDVRFGREACGVCSSAQKKRRRRTVWFAYGTPPSDLPSYAITPKNGPHRCPNDTDGPAVVPEKLR